MSADHAMVVEEAGREGREREEQEEREDGV